MTNTVTGDGEPIGQDRVDPETDVLRSQAAAEAADPRPSVVASIAALGLKPGMRVLDAGCGAGAHLRLFAETVGPQGRVIGLDVDPARLAVAKGLCADLIGSGRVRLEEGDLTRLPLAARGCDSVWSALVFHHLADPSAALAELARGVRPGGVVAVLDGDAGGSFPCVPWPPELELRRREAALRAVADDHGGTLPYHYAPFVGRELPRLFQEAGLADVRLHAFCDVDRAPLTPGREAEVRAWLIDARLRPYLLPRDWDRLERLADPSSAEYLPNQPGFFVARTWYLTTGRVR